jgi:hypothetical protein
MKIPTMKLYLLDSGVVVPPLSLADQNDGLALRPMLLPLRFDLAGPDPSRSSLLHVDVVQQLLY